jgi:hypothetical protein
MSSKKQPVVRKASKKVVKPIVRARDAATHDSGAVRFGNGSAPAILRK